MQLSKEGVPSEPSIEQFNEIVLSPEQEQEALRLGREREFYRRQEEAYRKRLTEPKSYPQFSAGQLHEFYKMQYKYDDDNADVVEQLCYYFSGDSRFTGDLKKGLFIFGNVGVGKSSIMQFFTRNQVFSYRMVSCREIEKHFSEKGYEAVDMYSGNWPISVNGNPFGHQIIGYCFDDLGTEDNSKFYGKEKNMMAEIILNRYDSKLPYNSTHITTNLTAKDIKEIYGTRVTDRLKEMVNIIAFDPQAKSRR